MEIKNEYHAREMLKEWQNLPEPVRRHRMKTAIEKLELNGMYYEQKGNEKGAARSKKCLDILKEHLDSHKG